MKPVFPPACFGRPHDWAQILLGIQRGFEKAARLRRALKIERGRRRGDQQTDMARLQAVNLGSAVHNKYNNANQNHTSDIAQYDADLALWDQRWPAMSQQDYNSCYGHLQAAYSAIGSANTSLAAAYSKIGAGDTCLDNGDNNVAPKTPLQWYLDAQAYYGPPGGADTDCNSAASQHITAAGHLAQAEQILHNYGGKRGKQNALVSPKRAGWAPAFGNRLREKAHKGSRRTRTKAGAL